MSTSSMPVKALGPPAAPERPLRSYQQEMLRYASSANTLVVLNTGEQLGQKVAATSHQVLVT